MMALDPVAPWPAPLGERAKIGLSGEFLGLVGPHSEADEAALLIQFLVAFGSVIGRGPHFRTEADLQFTNEFIGIVGKTSRGRKGSSLGHVKRRFPAWPIVTGLSSGEGLITAVRDATESDEGVSDKRVTVIQSELASTLKVMGREGSTLSPVMREAWDSGDLRIMTKNSPAQATGAHVSVIGHITSEELRRYLSLTEQGNGFANRFLWICAKRARLLPDGGRSGDVDFGPFDRALSAAIESAKRLGFQNFRRDQDASDLWHLEYEALSDDGRTGILGAVTSRAEAHVVKLSLLYALLDGETETIRERHLDAALEIWRYADDSARYIFEGPNGDPDEEKLLGALRNAGEAGLTRTAIWDLFGRHLTSARMDSLLEGLRRKRLADCRTEPTRGAPIERWTLIPPSSLNSHPGSVS